MRFKLLSLLIIFFGLLLAIPVKADTSTRGCETNTMKNGEYCNWAEGKSWNTSNTTICAVESTAPCPANPSNGTYNFSCNSNSCVLSCNSGYVRCGNTCTPVGSAPNCTNYNTCSGTCTTCAPGYTLSGGTCSAATLKLGSTSVGQSSLLQAGADALAYISGNKMGIGNSNPSANLHINASTDTEGLRIITSNYSPFIIRNAADTADLFRIDQDGNITSLGEITGSNNYWKLNGSDLYASSTDWSLGIGTTNPGFKLEVNGDTYLKGSLYNWGNANIQTLYLGYGSAFPAVLSTQSANEDLTINPDGIGNIIMQPDGNGNVGIGTTIPQSLLDVNGLIKMRTQAITQNEDVINKEYLASALNATGANLWGGSTSGAIYNVNTGNVGIGTTDPASELDVEGTVNSLAMNTLSLIANLADVNTSLDVGSGGASDGVFVNGRAEISGKLGVGMSSPTYPLDVTGNARIGQADNYGLYIGGTQRYLWARASGDLALGTGGSDRLTIDSAGNVGIGNTNPGARLQVTGDQVIFSVNQSAGSSGLSINSNLRLGTNTGYAWIQSHGSQPLSINALGNNVGINTTNPTARLEVNGTFKVTGALNSVVMDRLSGTGNRIVMADASGSLYATSSAAATGLPDGTTGQTLRHNGTSWAANSVLFNNGTNVGIGTTNPTAGFQVGTVSNAITSRFWSTVDLNGNKYLTFGSGDAAIQAVSGYNLAFSTYTGAALTEKMRVTSGGNVGIGTTAPLQKLDVDGSIWAYTEGGGDFEGIYLGEKLDSHTPYAWVSVSDTGSPDYFKSHIDRWAGAFDWTIGDTSSGEINVARLYSHYNSGTYFDLYKNQTDNTVKIHLDTDGDTYFQGGNIGIGTSAPGTRLTVVGSGNYSIDASNYKIGGVAAPTANTDAANKAYVDSAIPASLWSGTLNGNIWNGAAGVGNVGIGTNSPSAKLDIAGDVNLANYAAATAGSLNRGYYVYKSGTTAYGMKLQYANGEYGTMVFASNQANRFVSFGKTGAALEDDDMVEYMRVDLDNGNVGINTTNPSSKLHVVGNANITSTLTMGGDINMANNNITAINKLTVNTIDPLYNIKGINYSTFAPSMVGGVKEEYVGFAKIDQRLKTGEYENIIDFNQVAEGSDLWVWHKTIDFSPNNVQVIITPIAQFANTYYFIEDNKLVLRADKEVEVSYRLTGNRHDWQEWPTRALDQTEKAGFIID